MIRLTPVDLALAAALVLAAALLGHALRLGTTRTVLVAAARTVVQLLLIGFVLEVLFGHVSLAWVALLALVMLGVAGREVRARQHRRLKGWWSFHLGTLSMFVSSFAVTVLALAVIIGAAPWYTPQYAIPLLGMLLGNTMTGVSLGMDRLTQTAWEQRAVIETRLMLGQDWNQAIGDIRRHSIRSGMIPIVNAMAAAGLVSLPGMMTGQILAGAPPAEAVKYQILIMFLISAGTILGTTVAVWLASRRLFDVRQRLRLDRLSAPPQGS
jgi:putative ABC transport system permease protein